MARRFRQASFATMLALLLALSGGKPAPATDFVKLSGPEIKALLLGNSIEGSWGQAHFRSYFDPNGVTLYQEKGQPPEQGHWSVNDTQYCSAWEGSGTSCYDVYRYGEQVIWEDPGTGNRYPSALIAGKAVPW